jgi:hypothetical protein
MSQYQADIEKTSAWVTIQNSIYPGDAHYIPCGCPFNSGPCCLAGICQVGAACFAPTDAGADVQEADASADVGD